MVPLGSSSNGTDIAKGLQSPNHTGRLAQHPSLHDPGKGDHPTFSAEIGVGGAAGRISEIQSGLSLPVSLLDESKMG